MKIFFMLFLLLSVKAHAQWQNSTKLVRGFDPRNDVISDDYIAGPFLIYNCKKGHWACVLEEYYTSCKEERAQDERENRTTSGCAPVAEFDVKFRCYQEQLRLVSNVDPAKLCVLTGWKEHSIRFD